MGRTKTPAKTKSERARDLLAEGKSISDLTRLIPNMGYAFAYGIAKRTPHPDGGTYADHAANRRRTRAVTTDPETGIVKVATATGFVSVHPDGTVKRSKS